MGSPVGATDAVCVQRFDASADVTDSSLHSTLAGLECDRCTVDDDGDWTIAR